MLDALALVPAVPLASFAILALVGPRLSRRAAAICGTGSIGISAVISGVIALRYLQSPPPGGAFTQVLWTWISAGDFRATVGFYLDALSLLMMLVVTLVGFFIHLYSVEFMAEEEGYSRFFAYMNLFVASMLVLLLADNLLLLYLGWEGVGLSSYLLIGFWYQEAANGRAAQKAFIVTRAGDTAMAVGLFLLFTHLGTLDIQPLMQRATTQWAAGSTLPAIAAALLLAGAVGKSAQLPLQTWLPDAMAGPTPTSALIHAATMVTAGVYLIARTHVLFSLAPPVQLAVAVIGAATLLLAGFSALVQSDIKRVLAYSTISQIGYMFLALGVGAWAAAIFHFMTHAFFKALLFLAAGVVIEALHHEHNIFRMGGLWRRLPVAFWTFVIAGCALAGLPFVTAGFYSKDLILWQVWSSAQGGDGLWMAGIAGVLLTSLYIFRLIFLVFFGDAKMQPARRPGYAMQVPLLVLAFLSLVGGFVETPASAGDIHAYSRFMSTCLPSLLTMHRAGISEGLSQTIAATAFALGLGIAWLLFLRRRDFVQVLSSAPLAGTLHRLWYSNWGFDWLYDTMFVRPIRWLAHANRHDALDSFYSGVAALSKAAHRTLSRTQTGRLRWYAAGLAAGSVFFVAIALFL